MYGFILTVKSKEAIIGMSVYIGVNECRLSFSTLQGWICKINISFKDWIIVGPQHDIWAGQWKWFKFTLEYIKKKITKSIIFHIHMQSYTCNIQSMNSWLKTATQVMCDTIGLEWFIQRNAVLSSGERCGPWTCCSTKDTSIWINVKQRQRVKQLLAYLDCNQL